jgi:hypothetical protein
MEKSVRKVTPLVLALSMALVSGAFAGDNENATFTVTSSKLLTDVGAGELVEISIDGDNWVGVEQVDVTLEVSSPAHFDVSVAGLVLGADLPDANAFPPGNWRALGGLVEEGTDNRIKVGFALLDPDPDAVGHMGSADFTIRLLTSATLTADTEASVTVDQVSLGPSATDRDVIVVGEVIVINPPISEPELLRVGDGDVSLLLSGLGESEVLDGSGGEVTLAVRYIDPADEDPSGQTISWRITHNGGETIFALNGGATEAPSGGVTDVESTTDETGQAFLTLDASGDQDGSSTSAGITATTSGLDSEGQTVEVSASFTVTWDVPVPAELSGFAGDVTVDGDVALTWSVPSQTSNLGWEVHRSLDGKVFVRVGNLVPGDGTTDEFRQYEFVDTALPVTEEVHYYLRQVDLDGSSSRSQIISVALDAILPPVPTTFALNQNYPNPFNPETTIEFGLATDSHVKLVVYDLAGQVIRTLIAGDRMQAGHYTAEWDGINSSGVKVGSGVYLYRLSAGDFVEMKKMTLLQ